MKRINFLSLACIFWLSLYCMVSCVTRTTNSEIPGAEMQGLGLGKCQRTADMPEEMRLDNYRAPTPDCVPRGITLDTPELKQLIKLAPETILIDVLSVMSRPNTSFGEKQWIPSKERLSLPGSVWLPNVGYGYLDDEMQQYFKTQLHRLTLGDKHKPLVFFCIADCWMSWNAVQRAHDYGYSQVYWYKNGTDGWTEQGYQLQKIEPIPLVERE